MWNTVLSQSFTDRLWCGLNEKWWIMGRSRDQFGPEGPEVSTSAACRSPAARDQAKGRRVAGDPNLKLEAPRGTDSSQTPRWREQDSNHRFRPRARLLGGERTRILNRIKSTLARLGIRTFKPTLRKAAERLATVHTPEGVPLPPNTLAELQRDMARLGVVISQIRQIEEARQKRLEQQHETAYA